MGATHSSKGWHAAKKLPDRHALHHGDEIQVAAIIRDSVGDIGHLIVFVCRDDAAPERRWSATVFDHENPSARDGSRADENGADDEARRRLVDDLGYSPTGYRSRDDKPKHDRSAIEWVFDYEAMKATGSVQRGSACMLHRYDCPHRASDGSSELRTATSAELRSLPECKSCAAKSAKDTEFGYWPERASGIVERRHRHRWGRLWSEIEKLGPARFVVRSQFGTEHPAEFSDISEAIEAAKHLSFCPIAVERFGQAA